MNNHWSDYERYLKPIHLQGGERVLSIVRITEEETHPRPGEIVKSPVLWFKELPFGLILSPINRQTLIALYGDAVHDCIGKQIIVQTVAMRVGGRDRTPLRIQKRRPNATSVDTATGELVEPPTQHAEPEVGELDAHFGSAKLTAAPDYCTLHNVTMTEISTKSGQPYHRFTSEDGRVGFCNSVEVKFAARPAANAK